MCASPTAAALTHLMTKANDSLGTSLLRKNLSPSKIFFRSSCCFCSFSRASIVSMSSWREAITLIYLVLCTGVVRAGPQNKLVNYLFSPPSDICTAKYSPYISDKSNDVEMLEKADIFLEVSAVQHCKFHPHIVPLKVETRRGPELELGYLK